MFFVVVVVVTLKVSQMMKTHFIQYAGWGGEEELRVAMTTHKRNSKLFY